MSRFATGLVVGIVALIAGFATGAWWSGGIEAATSSQALAPRTDAASIMVDYGAGDIAVFGDLAVEPGTTLLDLTERTVVAHGVPFETQTFEGIGTMIGRIGEMVNGVDDSYWVYWVNNAEVPVGADQYEVRPGDVVLWKYRSFAP